jgi:AhpD family alkylhydroperoxidase
MIFVPSFFMALHLTHWNHGGRPGRAIIPGIAKTGGKPMATVNLLSDEELSPEASAVFADIRKTRQSEFVNNFWRALAHDPKTLRRTWESIKEVMAPGALDPKIKEMLYVAVSVAHGCSYCIHSHTAGARAKGMTETEYREMLAIVGMAAETNRLVTALGVPVDDAFLVDGSPSRD